MSKNIIICADGTWNAIEEKGNIIGDDGWQQEVLLSTNVSKLASIVDTHNNNLNPTDREQRLFYLEGVGTNQGDEVSGGAFGWGLSANVRAAYAYIVKNFSIGDKLYFFGFSRGAYTVRSLAGLINNSGIVRVSEEDWQNGNADNLINDALALYRDKTDKTKAKSIKATVFRAQNSVESEIYFLGVWDTVGALGFPTMSHQVAKHLGWDWEFHDVELGPNVKNAYHALGLHEQRTPFRPTLWYLKPENENKTNLEQVWFAGVHSDIGGGYAEDGLSRITLRWMLKMAIKKGLRIKKDMLKVMVENNPTLNECVLHESYTKMYALMDFLSGKNRDWRDFTSVEDGYENCVTNEKIHTSVLQLISKNWQSGDSNLKNKVKWPVFSNEEKRVKNRITGECKDGFKFSVGSKRSRKLLGTESVIVKSKDWQRSTGLRVEKGLEYKVTMIESVWWDAGIKADYRGWLPYEKQEKGLFRKWIMSYFNGKNKNKYFRCKDAMPFELCALVISSDGEKSIMPMGKYIFNNKSFKFNISGELYFFANDVTSFFKKTTAAFYENNRGALVFNIKKQIHEPVGFLSM